MIAKNGIFLIRTVDGKHVVREYKNTPNIDTHLQSVLTNVEIKIEDGLFYLQGLQHDYDIADRFDIKYIYGTDEIDKNVFEQGKFSKVDIDYSIKHGFLEYKQYYKENGFWEWLSNKFRKNKRKSKFVQVYKLKSDCVLWHKKEHSTWVSYTLSNFAYITNNIQIRD